MSLASERVEQVFRDTGRPGISDDLAYSCRALTARDALRPSALARLDENDPDYAGRQFRRRRVS